MRVFPDTNVLASAFTTRGLCADLLALVITEHQLVVGEVVLEELSRVLERRFGVPPGRIRDLEKFLRAFDVAVTPPEPASVPLRDQADRWILACARLGRADVIVTGDRELLDLGDLDGLRILSPRAFWEIQRRPGR